MVGASRQASSFRKELMTAHSMSRLPDLRLPGRRHRRDDCDPLRNEGHNDLAALWAAVEQSAR